MSEKSKIYFVSDVHLGALVLENKREHEIHFANWLDFISSDVSELYLLGDIFDFWYEYKNVVPKGFIRVLGKIANLTDNGVAVHFFTGNHDAWVYDYLPSETGVILHRHEYITDILGKIFFLAHGDKYESYKGYGLMKEIFLNKTLQWFYSFLHPNFAFPLAYKWSKSSRLSKNGIEEEIKIKNEVMYKFAECSLSKDCIDYFIFGHRHRMANEKIGSSSSFVLLGDWINYNSYGVFDGSNFELKIFSKTPTIVKKLNKL